MSVNDEDEHPWLRDEKRLIGDAVREGVPYWGACLGVQLLAASLGARVYPGDEPEVGLLPVTLTDAGRADPVLGGLPERFTTLQWHGDTFDLPRRAALLASSMAYPHQAFRFEGAYGCGSILRSRSRWRTRGRGCPPTPSRWTGSSDRVLCPH